MPIEDASLPAPETLAALFQRLCWSVHSPLIRSRHAWPLTLATVVVAVVTFHLRRADEGRGDGVTRWCRVVVGVDEDDTGQLHTRRDAELGVDVADVGIHGVR